MKVCPKCNQTYTDEELNFCLADGELLMSQSSESPTQLFNDASSPTRYMDSPRTTNPNHDPWQMDQPPQQPLAQWNQPQGMQNPGYGMPVGRVSRDQTLPTIALILGILCLPLSCVCGGMWLGIPAAICGFLGMRNADADPVKYSGKGMAIAGLILGIVGFVLSFIFLILQLANSR